MFSHHNLILLPLLGTRKSKSVNKSISQVGQKFTLLSSAMRSGQLVNQCPRSGWAVASELGNSVEFLLCFDYYLSLSLFVLRVQLLTANQRLEEGETESATNHLSILKSKWEARKSCCWILEMPLFMSPPGANLSIDGPVPWEISFVWWRASI